MSQPLISYDRTLVAREGYKDFISGLVKQNGCINVCDIGGGANPVLDTEFIEEFNINYTLLDISSEELDKAPANYNKIVADISSQEFSIDKKFDLVFSKMLAEHVKDGKQFHTNVFNSLADGGLAMHFFPTLFTFPFVVNLLVPEKLSSLLLDIFAPRDKYQHSKFPAYYSWCYGPTKSQINRITDLGYEIVEYRGFYGHNYYLKIWPLHKLHQLKVNYMLKNPSPLLTNYVYLLLRKPGSKDG